ncbi:hypothetical protein OsJ_22368 [Oryza sativa Japonica Group]|uniref:Uncharacterized protein n=1 Tax=Oryza sativa subsp. japonica TaxID=39947 RepID=B9FQH8_ORYSJ|nr:hypothetical protein OsJ_22368 [Oryza sativa Japonica Group]
MARWRRWSSCSRVRGMVPPAPGAADAASGTSRRRTVRWMVFSRRSQGREKRPLGAWSRQCRRSGAAAHGSGDQGARESRHGDMPVCGVQRLRGATRVRGRAARMRGEPPAAASRLTFWEPSSPPP